MVTSCLDWLSRSPLPLSSLPSISTLPYPTVYPFPFPSALLPSLNLYPPPPLCLPLSLPLPPSTILPSLPPCLPEPRTPLPTQATLNPPLPVSFFQYKTDLILRLPSTPPSFILPLSSSHASLSLSQLLFPPPFSLRFLFSFFLSSPSLISMLPFKTKSRVRVVCSFREIATANTAGHLLVFKRVPDVHFIGDFIRNV